ncbi:MAG: DUF1593 domain-containing protein [Paludibaculum sp.]
MTKSRPWVSLVAALLATVLSVPAQQRNSAPARPRVVITADPELDDNNTLIRAILYSSDVQVEGLIYTSSGVHWKGDGKGTTQYIPGREYTRMGLCPCTSWRWAPDDHFIDEIVDAYAKSYANLKIHNPDYPSPAELRSKIKWGNVEFDGDYSKDTDGSNLIKSLVLDSRPGPLYVTAQGGQSTIARALKSIYDQYSRTAQWEQVRSRVSEKLVIIPWGDQDGLYAKYIKPNWPGVTEWQLAMIDYGYGIRNGLAPENQVYVSAQWHSDHVLNRGPLGAGYRVWGDGRQMAMGDRTDYFGLSGLTADQLREMGFTVWTPPQEKGSFISEGDTPTFLNLVANGLRAHENGSWGGWGGIRRPANAPSSGRGGQPVAPADPTDSGIAPGLAPAGSTANAPEKAGQGAGPRNPPPAGFAGFRRPAVSPATAAVNARFFAASQNDFAARLKWSVTPGFSAANHPPRVGIQGAVEVTAQAGSTVRLRGEVSDPDRDAIRVAWWQYNDAGTYPGNITLSDPSSVTTTFRVPDDAQPGQTIHIIVEATDNGAPPLTRYQRVVVRVR